VATGKPEAVHQRGKTVSKLVTGLPQLATICSAGEYQIGHELCPIWAQVCLASDSPRRTLVVLLLIIAESWRSTPYSPAVRLQIWGTSLF